MHDLRCLFTSRVVTLGRMRTRIEGGDLSCPFIFVWTRYMIPELMDVENRQIKLKEVPRTLVSLTLTRTA